MKTSGISPLLAAVAVASLALPAHAADNSWLGLNELRAPDTANVSTNINDPLNWSTGFVPGVNDTAIFNFVGGDLADPRGDLFVTAADILFDPNRIEFNSNVDPNGFRQDSDLYIDKDLTLTNGLAINGFGDTGGSGQQVDRLRLGTQVSGVTINTAFIDITTGTSPGWAFFNLGAGTTLNLTGAAITFATPNNNLSQTMNTTGFSGVENAALDAGPVMRFTAVGGTIDLDQGADRTTGTIGLGNVQMAVRSDQTWTAEDLAFISMTSRTGTGANPGPYVVQSIDGARLDNLGAVNLRLFGSGNTASATNAQRLYGGTYGSVYISNNNDTINRSQRLNLADDVSFAGRAVDFAGAPSAPFQTEYSVILETQANSTNNRPNDALVFDFKGFDATLAYGLLLNDAAGSSQTPNNVLILAENSNLTIQGNVLFTGDASRLPGGSNVNSNIGIVGGAAGTTLLVGGNWEVQTLARTATGGSDNLNTSTFTMTGGDPVGAPVTFEVGDASATTGLQVDSWSILTLNVGSGPGDTAHVKLVNDYLNNNPFVSDVNVDKAGEKLIVGSLLVDENSILDANLSEVTVEITTTLMLATGATLDLNTGLSLTAGMTIDNFVGLGDQTINWTPFASQVIDSTNLGLTFNPFLDGGGNTVWQVVPEPGVISLLGIAGFVMVLRRRRRG